MARGVRWRISFKDREESDYVVNIYQEGYSGTVTALVGGASPVETQETGVNDPFEPVVGQTGYIRFIAESKSVVDAIKPTGTFDRFVEIKRGTTIVWVGYLALEEYSTPWAPPPYEVSLPLVSTLEVLKAVPFAYTQQERTFAQIVGQIINAANTGVTQCYLAKNFSTSYLFGFTVNDAVFSLRPSRQELTRYAGIEADMRGPGESYSCYDALSEICKYMGWSARDNGYRVFFTATDNTQSYAVCTVDNLVANKQSFLAEDTGADLALPQVRSASNTRSTIGSKSQVRVTVPIQYYEKDILGFSDLDWMEFNREIDTVGMESLPRKKYIWYGDLFSNDTYTKTNQYFLSTEGNPNGSTTVASIVVQNFLRDFYPNFVGGGLLCKEYIYRGFSNEGERGDVEDVFYMSTNESSESRDPGLGGTVVAEFLSRNLYTFHDSANLILQTEWEPVIYVDGELRAQPEETEGEERVQYQTRQYFIWRLVFERTNGEKLYWSDITASGTKGASGSWQTSPNYLGFFLTGGQQKIPLPSGTGRFHLYCQTTNGNATVAGVGIEKKVKYYKFTKLSLSLESTKKFEVRYRKTNHNELRFNKSTGAVSKDAFERTQTLYHAASYPQFNFSNGRVWGGSNTAQANLNRMATWAGLPRLRVTVDVYDVGLSPFRRVTFGSENYFVGARRVNWRNHETKVELLKL